MFFICSELAFLGIGSLFSTGQIVCRSLIIRAVQTALQRCPIWPSYVVETLEYMAHPVNAKAASVLAPLDLQSVRSRSLEVQPPGGTNSKVLEGCGSASWMLRLYTQDAEARDPGCRASGPWILCRAIRGPQPRDPGHSERRVQRVTRVRSRGLRRYHFSESTQVYIIHSITIHDADCWSLGCLSQSHYPWYSQSIFWSCPEARHEGKTYAFTG